MSTFKSINDKFRTKGVLNKLLLNVISENECLNEGKMSPNTMDAHAN